MEKDGIDGTYFILTYNLYNGDHSNYIDKIVQIPQFPKGDKLNIGTGKIKSLPKEPFLFFHNADTDEGSSGSPIILKDSLIVMGIHKGYDKNTELNVGIFIDEIANIIKIIKKNGKGKEYYKDGKIKYEGDFINDEYDGEGEYHSENGEVYSGQFKNGKRHGNGRISFKNDVLKEGTFNNDQFISDESYKNDNQDNYSNSNENNNVDFHNKEENADYII